MTHDLFKSFAYSFNFSVKEILISDLKEGVFFAKIVCNNGVKNIEIDARPSDAIAIGLRFSVPIFTYEAILSEAGIVLTDEADEEEETAKVKGTSKKAQPKSDQVKDQSNEHLKELLNEAIKKEDYEGAAKIRDEINRRN